MMAAQVKSNINAVHNGCLPLLVYIRGTCQKTVGFNLCVYSAWMSEIRFVILTWNPGRYRSFVFVTWENCSGRCQPYRTVLPLTTYAASHTILHDEMKCMQFQRQTVRPSVLLSYLLVSINIRPRADLTVVLWAVNMDRSAGRVGRSTLYNCICMDSVQQDRSSASEGQSTTQVHAGSKSWNKSSGRFKVKPTGVVERCSISVRVWRRWAKRWKTCVENTFGRRPA
jgi:hypothetical protein